MGEHTPLRDAGQSILASLIPWRWRSKSTIAIQTVAPVAIIVIAVQVIQTANRTCAFAFPVQLTRLAVNANFQCRQS
ncbi:hypothetical protein B5P45_08820 [Phyllobacterium zundukense]|uniref:Uncharacterized protein n=1 Tax=Phyllobacterium zundukense TaxID=1867719 RepID=A0A2N9W069_9HYPH|nr:hypothetical protein BLM14_02340 [Phyllobacterium zundukense]PIO45137.1 hypothetical protein B5P45_08820 [Phyllobacterium zundukense]